MYMALVMNNLWLTINLVQYNKSHDLHNRAHVRKTTLNNHVKKTATTIWGKIDWKHVILSLIFDVFFLCLIYKHKHCIHNSYPTRFFKDQTVQRVSFLLIIKSLNPLGLNVPMNSLSMFKVGAWGKKKLKIYYRISGRLRL